MRVLLMVTNAFFVASVVHAGHKRVIIRVPQRTKHIYHHQVKKVPVYVLLPEKKSKVLDDLEEVTKVLPCRERDRDRGRDHEPPWQDDIVAGPPPLPPSSHKYRYARHYDQIQDFGEVDVDGYGDTTSIWQQDTKRSLRSQPSQPQRQQQQQHHSPRRYKSARHLSNDHRVVGSAPTSTPVPASTQTSYNNGGGRAASAAFIRSPASSSSASLFQKGDRDEAIGATTGGGSERTRYARYYEYEDDYKNLPRPTKTSDAYYDNGRYNANTNRDSFTSGHVERSVESGGNQNVIGHNFIRIGYPSASALPSNFVDSSFHPSGGGDGDATAAAYNFSADRNHRRPQLVSSPSASLGLPSVADSYASSYQYKIQH